MDWPTEEAINSTGLNGEVDAPTYKVGITLCRINPVGTYALYWDGKRWRESAMLTNTAVRINGVIQQ